MSIKTYFINSTVATYSDEEFAWFQSLILNEGVIGDPVTGVIGLQVIQNGTPDMSVLVGTGKALVELTKSGRTFKVVVENDAQVQVTIPANASGANRVDAIIVRVDKDVDPNISKTNVSTIERVAGTGVAALSDGAIDTAVGSDGWYRLANVTVTNGDTDIVTGQIANTSIKVSFNNGMAFSPLFISSSVGAADAGKVPLLNGNGQLDKSFTKEPVIKIFTLAGATTGFGNSTTQFDITFISGTTYRYTWDGTGTDPGINATSVPIGQTLRVNGQNFTAGNNGTFTVTGSGASYFEVSNPSGVAELNKTLGTGAINYCYVPPADLKYLDVELCGGGAGANSTSSGGGGGYVRKRFTASALGAFVIWALGSAGSGTGAGTSTIFGTLTGGGGQKPGGGTATGGDINIPGGAGIGSGSGGTGGNYGVGGQSYLGSSSDGNKNAVGYGAGAAGENGGGSFSGAPGFLMITEYFN